MVKIGSDVRERTFICIVCVYDELVIDKINGVFNRVKTKLQFNYYDKRSTRRTLTERNRITTRTVVKNVPTEI